LSANSSWESGFGGGSELDGILEDAGVDCEVVDMFFSSKAAVGVDQSQPIVPLKFELIVNG